MSIKLKKAVFSGTKVCIDDIEIELIKRLDELRVIYPGYSYSISRKDTSELEVKSVILEAEAN